MLYITHENLYIYIKYLYILKFLLSLHLYQEIKSDNNLWNISI